MAKRKVAKKTAGKKSKARGKPDVELRKRIQELEKFAAERREWISALRTLLKLPKSNPAHLDPKIRHVTIKFSQLPFAYMYGNCEGYFYRNVGRERKRVQLGKIKPGQKVFCEVPYFEMVFDNSPESNKLKAVLKKFASEKKVIELVEMGRFTKLKMLYADHTTTINRSQAEAIIKVNNIFITGFGRIVNRFVAKYGIGRDAIRRNNSGPGRN